MNEEGAGILIVEGENLVAKDLEQPLAKLGYRILAVVESGRKAVQVAEQIRPDLALMDAQLTGSMDSYTAAGEIRNRLKIPIVFLTPESEEDALKHRGAITKCGYVAKPLRSTELNAAILVAASSESAGT
jgi:CheY-like chemotaxis protein